MPRTVPAFCIGFSVLSATRPPVPCGGDSQERRAHPHLEAAAPFGVPCVAGGVCTQCVWTDGSRRRIVTARPGGAGRWRSAASLSLWPSWPIPRRSAGCWRQPIEEVAVAYRERQVIAPPRTRWRSISREAFTRLRGRATRASGSIRTAESPPRQTRRCSGPTEISSPAMATAPIGETSPGPTDRRADPDDSLAAGQPVAGEPVHPRKRPLPDSTR